MALVNPVASTSSNEANNMSTERKKKTRPITACQTCHRAKIKCVLKPNEPVCQRCSSIGNECLFRVDDLAPTLRLEKFSDHTPTSIDVNRASITKGRLKEGSFRGRTFSSSSTGEGDNGRSDDFAKASNKKTANGKAKAVFRSFANPAKLAAPSRTSLSESRERTSYHSNGHYQYTQRDEMQASSSTTSIALPSFNSSFKHVDSESFHPYSNSSGQAHIPQGQRYHYKFPSHPSYKSLPIASKLNTRPSSSTLAVSKHGAEIEADERARKKSKLTEKIVDGRQPPVFKKIALPFFRWFGATANTPGIRRIKVGVYHEVGEENAQTGRAGHVGANLEERHGPRISSFPHRKGHGASTVNGQEVVPREVAWSDPPKCRCATDSFVSASSPNLFESERLRYPRREILIKMIKIVVKHYKASCFPWLDEEELMAGAESGELPAILANSICAVSAQISNHADLRRGNGKKGGEPFADMAKVLVVPMLSWPSLDVIEALVIISYAEFAAGADSGLWMYIGMALRMATDLGLQYETTIKSMSSLKQQNRARLLFWAIVSLDRITCFGTGRSVSIREDSFDCQLPALGNDLSTSNFVFGHIVQTLLKRGRIGELLNQKGDELLLEERGQKLKSIWHDLTHYYETLPPTLQFGVTTFRNLASTNQGAAFVYLHVLLQSTMSLLNRPSIFRRFDKDFNVSVPSRLASIASHASGTIVSILRFAEDASTNRTSQEDEDPNMNPYIDCNPYLDQLILPAGRAFLAEKEGVRDALRRLGYAAQSRPVSRGGTKASFGSGVGHEDPASNSEAVLDAISSNQAVEGPFNGLIGKRQYAQMNLSTCQRMLDRLALRWSGAEWPARALRQETAGATEDDNDLDSNDEDTQPAPVRDVEMVLKWAKSRTKKPKANGDTTATRTPRQESTADVDLQGIAAAVDPNQDFMSLMPSHYLSSESNFSGDSPLGLGFSGSFGTTTEIDIDALINSWTAEERFMDSTQQGRQPIMHRSQDWDTTRSGQLIGYEPDPPTLDGMNGSFQPQSMDVTQPNSHLQMVDLDYDTMQLEEFFKTGLEPSRPIRF